MVEAYMCTTSRRGVGRARKRLRTSDRRRSYIYNCRRGRGSTAVAKALSLFIYTHIVSTSAGRREHEKARRHTAAMTDRSGPGLCYCCLSALRAASSTQPVISAGRRDRFNWPGRASTTSVAEQTIIWPTKLAALAVVHAPLSCENSSRVSARLQRCFFSLST